MVVNIMWIGLQYKNKTGNWYQLLWFKRRRPSEKGRWINIHHQKSTLSLQGLNLLHTYSFFALWVFIDIIGVLNNLIVISEYYFNMCAHMVNIDLSQGHIKVTGYHWDVNHRFLLILLTVSPAPQWFIFVLGCQLFSSCKYLYIKTVTISQYTK